MVRQGSRFDMSEDFKEFLTLITYTECNATPVTENFKISVTQHNRVREHKMDSKNVIFRFCIKTHF